MPACWEPFPVVTKSSSTGYHERCDKLMALAFNTSNKNMPHSYRYSVLPMAPTLLA